MNERKRVSLCCKVIGLCLIVIFSFGCGATKNLVSYTEESYSNLSKIHLKRNKNLAGSAGELVIIDPGIVVLSDGTIAETKIDSSIQAHFKQAKDSSYSETGEEMISLGTKVGTLAIGGEIHYDRVPEILGILVTYWSKPGEPAEMERFRVLPGHEYFFEVGFTGKGIEMKLLKSESLGDGLAEKEILNIISPEEFLDTIDAYETGVTSYAECYKDAVEAMHRNALISLKTTNVFASESKENLISQHIDLVLKSYKTVSLTFQNGILEGVE